MELLVERDEVVLVSGVGRSALPDQQQPQPIDVLDRHHLARMPNRDRLERLAEGQDLGAVLGRESADDQLAPRSDLDEALVEQTTERVADGRSRLPESLGDVALRQDAADRERAAQDSVPDVVVGVLGQLPAVVDGTGLGHAATPGAPAARRRVGRFRSRRTPRTPPATRSRARSGSSPSARP